jgi:hypothetical protein
LVLPKKRTHWELGEHHMETIGNLRYIIGNMMVMCTPNTSWGNSCQVYRGKKGIKVPYFEGKRKKGKVHQVRAWLYKISTQYNKVPQKNSTLLSTQCTQM